jgi:antitoxin component of MazEF toxin-antitoxin module
MKIKLNLSKVSSRYIKGWVHIETLPDDVLKALDLNPDTALTDAVLFEGEFDVQASQDEAKVHDVLVTLYENDKHIEIETDSRFDIQDLAYQIEDTGDASLWYEENQLSQKEKEYEID